MSSSLRSAVSSLSAFSSSGKSNDALRQEWMSTAVPFCESIGVDVPAHLDEGSGQYVVDIPFPLRQKTSTVTFLRNASKSSFPF